MKEGKSINRVADMNVLLNSLDQCLIGSAWKESVQRCEANAMLDCYTIKKEVQSGTYRPGIGRQFVQIERGKARSIKAPSMTDRIVQKALNQTVLLPEVVPRLIYDDAGL